MVQDMTEGKPLKMILSFSIPLLIGNLFQQLYNMADSVIVGRMVGMNALAALGATGAIFFLIIGSVMGLTTGFLLLLPSGSAPAMKKVCAVLWPCPFCFVSSLPFC